jgi:uncharacterized lipoprotein
MRYTLPTLAAVAVLALAGCSSDTEPAATPTTEKSSPSAPAVSSAPSPNAAQTTALLDALRAVKPELVADEERAVTRARNVCRDVKSGKPADTVASNAKARFSGGSAGDLTDAQGAAIVSAVKSSFCA